MAAKKKTEAVVTEKKNSFPKPTERDFEILSKPVITEKSMALMQDGNKITIRVAQDANKIAIKLAFERVYQVKVVDVKVSNVRAKSTTRGTRYRGYIQGYKKAVVTLASGEAIDLFKE